jgi:hypothetical protein
LVTASASKIFVANMNLPALTFSASITYFWGSISPVFL